MKMIRFTSVLLILLGSALTPVAQENSGDASPLRSSGTTRPPALSSDVALYFPMRVLNQENISEGYAIVKFFVDEEGNASDFICTEASHPAFADAAVNGLTLSQFRPALENGKPIPVTTSLQVNYSYGGGIILQSVMHDTMKAMVQGMDMTKSFELVPATKLDEPPTAVETGTPVVVVDEDGSVVAGSALIQYYINRDGRVRLPSVKETTDPRIAEAAIAAIRQTRFKPPLKNGRPVPTKVVQPYNVR